MKNQFFPIALVFLLCASCSLFNNEDQDDPTYIIVPDSTLLVNSVITYSAEYQFYGVEVILARLLNTGKHAQHEQQIAGSYWPIVRGQMLRLASWIQTDIAPEQHAEIRISNITKNSSLILPIIAPGVYADNLKLLSYNPGDSVTLKIKLSNGLHYFSSTRIPQPPTYSIADTITTNLDLIRFNTGGYAETSKIGDYYTKLFQPFGGLIENHAVEYKVNLSSDQYVYGLNQSDTLPNNYLRFGHYYGCITSFIHLDSAYRMAPFWNTNSSFKLFNQVEAYMTLSNLDPFLSTYYYNYYDFINVPQGTLRTDPIYQKSDSLIYDKLAKDNSFLFRQSNIINADSNGEPLFDKPKDALGIFGSRSSVYRKTVLLPIRSWDPDTLNWAKE